MRQAALIILALAACHHGPPPPPPTTSTPAAAEVRVACERSTDCGAIAVPGGYDCFHACENHVCQVEATTQTAGAGPCVGEKEGTTGAGDGEPGDASVYFLCDALANLYCDHTSRRCAAVKPVGAACTRSPECGLGATCDAHSHRCTVQKLGDACDGGDTCGRDGTCDPATHVCTLRKPDGAACKSFGECLSHQCDDDTGVCVRPPPKACTATR